MDKIRQMLQAYKQGLVEEDQVVEEIVKKPFEVFDIGRFDHQREARTGIPEVILAEGKEPEAVAQIMHKYKQEGRQIIASRVTDTIVEAVDPEGHDLYYVPRARVIATQAPTPDQDRQKILVISAGMLDRPVADETFAISELLGNPTEQLLDVGVAGLNRLAHELWRLEDAGVIIVVAGMDGALPSVIGGLAHQPVIAVPTSVGYGASFQGVAALLTMLNSCSAGVAVMNIDNGFGAAVMATKINRLVQRHQD